MERMERTGAGVPEVFCPPLALSSYTIGLGLHNLEPEQEPGSQMMEASLSIQHPEYNEPSMANDLMLIKLKESVSLSDTVRNISVVSQCPTPGDSCLVSGWGRLASGELRRVGVSALAEGLSAQPEGLIRCSASQADCPKCCSV